MYSEGSAGCTYVERMREMSFNCVCMKDDIVYIGADSRLCFDDGSFVDTNQKLFTNKDLNIVWSMTGETIYNHIHYFNLINSIMNNKNATTVEKLDSIQMLMNSITKRKYMQTNKDSFFDMFVGVIENNRVAVYTLESKNGFANQEVNKRYKHFYINASGMNVEQMREITQKDLFELSCEDMVYKISNLINHVMKIDKSNTVGGDVYVATMTKDGIIKTYINGKEKEF